MKIIHQILIIMFLMSHLSCPGQSREERDRKATDMLGSLYFNQEGNEYTKIYYLYFHRPAGSGKLEIIR